MTDCAHDIHPKNLEVLKQGLTDRVQCQKCGAALSLLDLGEELDLNQAEESDVDE